MCSVAKVLSLASPDVLSMGFLCNRLELDLTRTATNLVILTVIVGGFLLVSKYGQEPNQHVRSAILSDLCHQGEIVAFDGDDIEAVREGLLMDSSNKPVVVNFGASWCDACDSEKPFLKKLHSQFGERFKFVAVASWDHLGDLRESASYRDLGMPVLLDPEGAMAKVYGVTTVPHTVLFDPDGTVRHRFKGAMDSGYQNQFAKVLTNYTSRSAEPATALNKKSHGSLPEFELTDHNGNALSAQRDLEGYVWVANFVFTSCGSMCPLLTKKMAKLQAAFADAADFRMVSISVDPATDTPPVLLEYGKKYQADFEKWVFLTGDWLVIKNVLQNGFRIGVPDQPMFHTEKFVLVDRGLQIRGYYSVNTPASFDELQKDLRALLARTEKRI